MENQQNHTVDKRTKDPVLAQRIQFLTQINDIKLRDGEGTIY